VKADDSAVVSAVKDREQALSVCVELLRRLPHLHPDVEIAYLAAS